MSDLSTGPTTTSVSVVQSPKSVGLLSLIVIGFFWVSGGIYGNEELVKAAPPLIALLFTLLIPICFSLPSALVTAELATAFPADGGQVVWVEEAFGAALGGHNAYWLWLTNLIDAAVYPQMMMRYLRSHLHLDGQTEHLVCVAIICTVAAVSMLGIDWISKTQGVMFVLTVGPALLFIGFGIPSLEPKAWSRTDGDIDAALLLSWVLWLYSGFAWLGNLAGEVEAPQRTYVAAMAVLLPLVSTLNLLPFLVSLSIDADTSHYSAGYFEELARVVAGKWLEVLFVIGANAALLGLYHSQTIAADTVLAAVAHRRLPSLRRYSKVSASLLDGSAEKDAHFLLVSFRAWLFSSPSSGGSPRFVILIDVAAIGLLLMLHYQALVEVEMMLYSLSHLLFFGAHLALRVQQPQVPRALKLPGGLRAALAIVLVPSLICVITIGVNLRLPSRALAFGGALLLGGGVHLVAAMTSRVCWRQRSAITAQLLPEQQTAT